MERRFYLGIAILLGLLVLGIWAGKWTENANTQVVQYLSQAEEAIREGDPAAALVLTREARLLWEKGWNRLAVMADHTIMDEIDGLFSQMEHYAREGTSFLGASCARVRELVSAVSDDHRLTWWNLL